ncbi:MAG TPA: mechanosensitive ion channel [Phycisphaerae bacterium]|nr:mechanosensitive ion channel [Phycisphaerae bacterium]HRY68402.1 mechanosensitive ion channel [Phycisphaerae bacterium]HSA27819.1 mechanosensitive ion channel [Phycisphaerae bacterium]
MKTYFPVLLSLATSMSLATLGVAAEPPKPTTVSDPKIAVSDLQLMAKPLTKAQLAAEADAWLGLLQSKATEISTAEIASGKAEGDEKTKILETVAQLREERTALIDRLNAVLAALKAKGGTTTDHDAYISAVSGIAVKMTDASGLWTTLVHWLKSTEGGLRYGKNILLFLATLIVFKILGSALGKVTFRAMGAFKNVSSLLRDFTVNTVRKVTFFVGFVVALSMLEVNIGPFLAAMGAAGFVIAFALQGTLSNFAAGIMILLYRPYDMGDTVTVAGVKGSVASMSLVSTVLKNADGHIVTVPNSSIWGGTITNHSAPA